jgi:hypothetical protein
MLQDGWIGPARGTASNTMWPPIGLTVADHLGAPAALWTAPRVRPPVPALLGTVVAQTSVLDTELPLVVPHSKLLARRAAPGYAPAAAHLPRSLAVHRRPPQEAEPGPALRPESAGSYSQRGRDCTRDVHAKRAASAPWPRSSHPHTLCRALLVACGDAAVALEPVDQPLDHIPFAIDRPMGPRARCDAVMPTIKALDCGSPPTIGSGSCNGPLSATLRMALLGGDERNAEHGKDGVFVGCGNAA